MAKQNHIIGIDLGGTKILSALIDMRGRIIQSVEIPSEAGKGKQRVISNIKRSVNLLLSDREIKLPSVKAIGVGAPGPIQLKKGLVLNPPNLPGWNKVPLKKILESKFGKRVVLDNDANAAALAEWKFGSGKGTRNFIFITVSTGIGGGIIINGRPYRGSAGGAGEIGHMIIKADGEKCGCGNSGCLEAMASGTSMAKRAMRRLANNGRSLILDAAGGNRSRITAKSIEIAARSGDRLAREIIDETAYYLGIGLANLINIFAPDMIALGGGVMKAGSLILSPASRIARSLSLSPAREKVKITSAKLRENVGVLGAAALCLEGTDR